jgi:hypothetical protein
MSRRPDSREKIIERLLRNSTKVPCRYSELGDCLESSAAPDSSGYPQASLNCVTIRAARVILDCGPGEMALHKCDNRKCINIEHLYKGTRRQNELDKWARNKHEFMVARSRCVESVDREKGNPS